MSSENALSFLSGSGNQPKDFDWIAKNIPCRTACPARTDIPGYLDAIRRGNPEEAYRINLRDNVFPAVLGRTCTRPCEPACRHGWEGLGEPVAICFSKRSADDFQLKQEPMLLEPLFPDSGKRVAIIGGGASGLACARELCLWGHKVDVFERHSEAGGLMIQGIPEFRLPRDIVRREVDQVRRQGVNIRCNEEIDREGLEALKEEYDAVIWATGTHRPRMPELDGADLPGVEHGLTFLKRINAGETPDPGRKVVVVGGGFTAVDCARMARRLGAEDVRMIYRRSKEEMYVGAHELEQFEIEGVVFEFLSTPVACLADESGTLRAVRFQRTELQAQEDGRAIPVPVAGSEFEVEADLLLLGTGQEALPLPAEAEGLFLAGDAVQGPSSLIDSIGHGKNCARDVDRFLMGKERFETVVIAEDADLTGRKREWDKLPRKPMPELKPADRELRNEVEIGYEDEDAKSEASRCYLCNFKFEIDNELCIYCDRCLQVTPVDDCIVKVSDLIYDGEDRITGYIRSKSTKDYNRLHLDQNQCIRCNACVEVCPVECITLQKVSEVIRPVS